MDCSAFRRHHVAYVDDTLPGDLVVAAARHAAECAECARHDTTVRRSLLLARNICGRVELECSDDFQARLEARLRRGDGLGDRSGLPGDDWAPRPLVGLVTPRRARQALAAAAMLAAVSTGAILRPGDPPPQIQGLGGGSLATFGSPFTPVAVDDGPLAPASYDGGGLPSAGLGGLVTGESNTALAPGSAELVAYDGSLDAGALVAPASVGVPVWAAVVLAGEVPVTLWRGNGEAAVELGRATH